MAETTGKKPGKIKSFFKGAAKYFRDTKSEMKKVVWPSKKQTINNTIVVLVVVAVSAAAILLLDLGFGGIFRLLIGA